MKIDLHVHTMEKSPCAKSTAAEQIRAAMSAGLDGVALTDHGRLQSPSEIDRLNREYYPFLVIPGIEVSVPGGHLIVLGVRNREIETREWTYPDLRRFVMKRNGFLALAHPYRNGRAPSLPIDDFPPDAFELYSNNTPENAAAHIEAMARASGSRLLSNSDAHMVASIGRYYNLLDVPCRNEREVLAALKAGRFSAVMHCQDGTIGKCLSNGPGHVTPATA